MPRGDGPGRAGPADVPAGRPLEGGHRGQHHDGRVPLPEQRLPGRLAHRPGEPGARREIGDRDTLCLILANTATNLVNLGQKTEATATFERALTIAREVENGYHTAYVLGSLAKLHESRGDLREALALSRQAVAQARRNNTYRLGLYLAAASRLMAAGGQLPEAGRLRQDASIQARLAGRQAVVIAALVDEASDLRTADRLTRRAGRWRTPRPWP